MVRSHSNKEIDQKVLKKQIGRNIRDKNRKKSQNPNYKLEASLKGKFSHYYLKE